MATQLSKESYFGLGKVPIGIGAVLSGWHGGPGSVLDFRAMTEKCPHNCYHCFTDKRKKDLTSREIYEVIEQARDLGFTGINYLGEGEPTIDDNITNIVMNTDNYWRGKDTKRRMMWPIIFTDAATKLNKDNHHLVETLGLYDASICPKCDSLFNEEYQNWVVGDKTGRYFFQRNESIKYLMELGFNRVQEGGRTRLGFDMVVTKRNVDEVEQTLRYCRDNNLWIVFTTYLPAGRSGSKLFDDSLTLSKNELDKMRSTVQRVDAEYGFNHPIFNNFATFPCVEFMQIYGNGDVSPCPGNETIVGNVRTESLANLAKKIRERFPCHKLENQTGNCAYRSK